MLVDVKEFFARLRVAIADTSGPWEIHFRGKRKLCTNETTARAWALYFRRNYRDGWTAYIMQPAHRKETP